MAQAFAHTTAARRFLATWAALDAAGAPWPASDAPVVTPSVPGPPDATRETLDPVPRALAPGHPGRGRADRRTRDAALRDDPSAGRPPAMRRVAPVRGHSRPHAPRAAPRPPRRWLNDRHPSSSSRRRPTGSRSAPTPRSPPRGSGSSPPSCRGGSGRWAQRSLRFRMREPTVPSTGAAGSPMRPARRSPTRPDPSTPSGTRGPGRWRSSTSAGLDELLSPVAGEVVANNRFSADAFVVAGDLDAGARCARPAATPTTPRRGA